MDPHTIYANWSRDNIVPSPRIIAYVMLSGDRQTMELVALMYRQAGLKMQMFDIFQTFGEKSRHSLAETVDKMWTTLVQREIVVSRELLEMYPSLQLHMTHVAAIAGKNSVHVGETKMQSNKRSATQQPATPRQAVRRPATPNETKTADDLVMENYSKSSIRAMCRYLNCMVSAQWVRAVASDVLPGGSDYPLLGLQSGRHVHHIDPSVRNFLQRLDAPSQNAPSQTVTWQFAEGNKQVIHVSKLRRCLLALCPKNHMAFFILIGSIGLPLRDLLPGDSVFSPEIVDQWKQKRFAVLNRSNVTRLLLEPRFKIDTKLGSDTLDNQLLNEYREHFDDFESAPVGNNESVDSYFVRNFYSYPRPDEMDHLLSRISENVHRWTSKQKSQQNAFIEV